ncbi:hypothetical protein QUF64_01055 [Anaerolineales bacterium HSG6]|nr:hypothetical protein [Anaerolineales bacterium HSG6]MDM8530515.1 hypothetical protein [Anaerolineales bacterium HSG25]
MRRFDYMICSSQLMRITFVNGRWQGTLPPDMPNALNTCPDVWEFLQQVGSNGWELISTNAEANGENSQSITTLYLKRERL